MFDDKDSNDIMPIHVRGRIYGNWRPGEPAELGSAVTAFESVSYIALPVTRRYDADQLWLPMADLPEPSYDWLDEVDERWQDQEGDMHQEAYDRLEEDVREWHEKTRKYFTVEVTLHNGRRIKVMAVVAELRDAWKQHTKEQYELRECRRQLHSVS